MIEEIIVDSVAEAQKIYDKLSVDAQNITLELQETFWSPAYAYPDRTAYASLRDQLNTIRDRYKKLQPTKKTNKTAAMSSENGTV